MQNSIAYKILVEKGIHPSVQRLAIMRYLLTNLTHPTVDEVYRNLVHEIPTLSRTTVYNTLRLFSEHGAVQMITVNDHHVCYDGDTTPHVHFFCKSCGKVIDMYEEDAPNLLQTKLINGHLVNEMQLYYKGICKDCQQDNHIN